MTRGPGFETMDVDVAVVNDPKFKRIARARPDHLMPAFMAYIALLGQSWKDAERATIADAWPPLIPFDPDVVESMTTAQLVDRTGRIPIPAWRKRFTEANRRRQTARERWARYNERRPKSGNPNTTDDAATTSLPRGRNAVTATSVPTVPTVPSEGRIPPPPAERGRRSNGTSTRQLGANGRAQGTSPRQVASSPRQQRDDEKHGVVPSGELERLRQERARHENALTPEEVKAQVDAYLADAPLAPRPPVPGRS
jgi:hypothetical protein